MSEEKETKVHFNNLYDESQFRNMYPWIEGLLWDFFSKGFDYAKERTENEREQG